MTRRLLAVVAILVVLASGCGIEEQIRVAFSVRGATAADQDKAVHIARCESGLDPAVANGQYTGLFQLGRAYHEGRAAKLGFTWDRMREAAPNAAVAADLWAEVGWSPWRGACGIY
ncbi:MAG: hypothetical protein IPM45_02965 [Acidimicrobiales bacterium]|nr:hypothetical protein [Acidimicrobiales bacterium]